MCSVQKMEKIKVQGTCSNGYEKLRALFEDNFRKGLEENAQLCIYVDGEKVVDLYGTAVGDEKYGPDTLTNMFSSGKSIAATVVAMMVDKGLLSYDQKVEHYWPEFGQLGKKDITVADVLRHEAGLHVFGCELNPSDFSRESIKSNIMGKLIEDLEPRFPTKEYGISNPDGTETRRAYHALTRGWILNEIVRRVDSQQRTIGEIIEQEIGIEGVRCGISEHDFKNASQLTAKSLPWLLRDCITPKAWGGVTDMDIFGLVKLIMMTQTGKSEFQKVDAKKKPEIKGMSTINPASMADVFNQKDARRGEAPSANCHGSARGMAELASIMANKGKRVSENAIKDGKQPNLMCEDTWQQMHDGEKLAVDAGFPIEAFRTNFTQGGFAVFNLNKYTGTVSQAELGFNSLREGYYGWMGFGGSILQWHPELNIGFAYANNNLQWWEFNMVGGRLQTAATECVKELKQVKK